MDPATMAIAATAGQGVFKGISGYQAGKAEQEKANINSFIARTRAAQTDTDARQGLTGELGSMRAALGANGQRSNVGTLEMFNELRDVRNRERRVDVGNRMQEASDFKTAANNAGQNARMALIGGGIKAAPSLFDLYQGI